MTTFKLGEFMVKAAIQNLKDGTISETIAITYTGNYCIKGWITDAEMQAALARITAIAAGEPDPAVAVVEEVVVEPVTAPEQTITEAEMIDTTTTVGYN